MRKAKYNIWELLCFIFGCTVCAVLLINVLGALVLNIPTTAINQQIRLQLIDLLKYIAGAIIGIASAKVVGKKNDTHENEN